MIKEVYVSFEIAKLLKEKGFNESIRCWYDNFQNFHEEGVKMTNTDCLPPTIMCPTQTMAMAWLREVHNLFIQVEFDPPTFSADIYKMDEIDEYGSAKHIQPTFANIKSYEKAIEIALEYSLENLI